ncbi:MAG: hypothetical protein BRC44_12275 [Cyanobacteria bacterium QS_4_48_99]|nr:MAG: hypothetical protein BRC44_12275 [Cyanobacteria bacterium QS_4_48_99]
MTLQWSGEFNIVFALQEPINLANSLRISSMAMHTKKIACGALVGVILLGLSAIPAFAQNHNRTSNHEQSATTLAQTQEVPTGGQMNQMMERQNTQLNQMRETMEPMGQMAQRCNSMMGMMMKNGETQPGMSNFNMRQ